MMTIVMYCDRCDNEIPPTTNGGVRVRTGKRELAFHLCSKHQSEFRKHVFDWCVEGEPRDVQPSLKRDDS